MWTTKTNSLGAIVVCLLTSLLATPATAADEPCRKFDERFVNEVITASTKIEDRPDVYFAPARAAARLARASVRLCNLINNPDIKKSLADLDKSIGSIEPDGSLGLVLRAIAGTVDRKELDPILSDIRSALLRARLVDNNALMAQIHVARGNLDQALFHYNEDIRASAFLFENRGEVWRKKGDLERALADYATALEIDPFSNARTYRNEVRALLKQRAMGASGSAAPLEIAPSQCDSKTIDVCSEIIEEIKSPRLRSEAFVNRAHAYLGQSALEADKESVDKAFADFNEAVRLDARNGLYFRMHAHISRNEFDLALRDADDLIRVEPDKKSYWFNVRADLHKEKGDLDRALSDQDEAIKAAPFEPVLLIRRGKLLTLKGDLNGALAAYEAALKIDPEDFSALRGRADVQAQLKNPK